MIGKTFSDVQDGCSGGVCGVFEILYKVLEALDNDQFVVKIIWDEKDPVNNGKCRTMNGAYLRTLKQQ